MIDSISFLSAIFIICCLDVWVRQDLAPETGDLMRIVDLHDVELLDNFLVNLQPSLFEWWHNLLSQVDRDKVMQSSQVFDFFVSLKR